MRHHGGNGNGHHNGDGVGGKALRGYRACWWCGTRLDADGGCPACRTPGTERTVLKVAVLKQSVEFRNEREARIVATAARVEKELFAAMTPKQRRIMRACQRAGKKRHYKPRFTESALRVIRLSRANGWANVGELARRFHTSAAKIREISGER
jgi:hypothetical protein